MDKARREQREKSIGVDGARFTKAPCTDKPSLEGEYHKLYVKLSTSRYVAIFQLSRAIEAFEQAHDLCSLVIALALISIQRQSGRT